METRVSEIKPRGYQIEAIQAVREAYQQDKRRLLIALPTGSGKTIIFAMLIQRRKGNALVLAHRDELIQSAYDKIKMVIPNADIGIVKAERNEIDAPIVIASIQTLSRQSRLEQIPAHFDTIIVDEAHHAAAESYRRTLDYLGAFDEGGPLVVGVTATPSRADDIGLDCVFEQIVYSRTILDMMKAGYLCDLRALQIHLEADFQKLHTRAGDFIEREVADLLSAANAPALIAEAYQEHAADRKGLVFTPTVDLAHDTAKAFMERGIAAEALDGGTDIEKRRAILARLKSGETQVVANCAVLTEGFDEPSVDCVVIARPTRSRTFFIQCIGRGTRLYPGKENCLVLDLVGTTERHDLMTMATLFGLQPKALSQKTVLEALAQQDQDKIAEQKALSGRLVAQAVDLFKVRQFHWLKVNGSRYTLAFGQGLLILQRQGSLWDVYLKKKEGNQQTLAEQLPLEYAQGRAEDYARESGDMALINPDAPWRIRPASEKQIATMKKMRIKFHPGLTSGEASDLIASKLAR